MKNTWTYRHVWHRLLRAASPLFLLTVGLVGCGGAVRRLPTRTDSVLAAIQFSSAVSNYRRFLQESRPELAVRADVVVTRMPDPTQDRRKSDA